MLYQSKIWWIWALFLIGIIIIMFQFSAVFLLTMGVIYIFVAKNITGKILGILAIICAFSVFFDF